MLGCLSECADHNKGKIFNLQVNFEQSNAQPFTNSRNGIRRTVETELYPTGASSCFENHLEDDLTYSNDPELVSWKLSACAE